MITIHVAKTKAEICAFVFAYANCWFSDVTAQMLAILHILISDS